MSCFFGCLVAGRRGPRTRARLRRSLLRHAEGDAARDHPRTSARKRRASRTRCAVGGALRFHFGRLPPKYSRAHPLLTRTRRVGTHPRPPVPGDGAHDPALGLARVHRARVSHDARAQAHPGHSPSQLPSSPRCSGSWTDCRPRLALLPCQPDALSMWPRCWGSSSPASPRRLTVDPC